MNILPELKKVYSIIKELDKKVITIFLAVGVLQTVSWYFTSRRFFRISYFEEFQFHPDVYLIEYLYWFVGDFITFFLPAILIIKFLFRESLRDYGLQIGDYRNGFKYIFIFVALMIPVLWFISSTESFAKAYPHLSSARESWQIFLIYEAGIILYMIGWEFFWRGFMLFGLEEKFGYYTVLIQMIPFLILHNGKPVLETFGAIVAGIALGILALGTRSIFYCIIAHAGVMFSMDLISSLRYRADDYGTGFSSIINIFSQLF